MSHRRSVREYSSAVLNLGEISQRLWAAQSVTHPEGYRTVASYDRMRGKYGERAEKYVHIEVGHAVQNVYLQATSLNLATVVVGSFIGAEVKTIFGFNETEHPMVLMPVGRPR